MRHISFFLLIFSFIRVFAQLPNPAIVGYWENWRGTNFIALKDIDSRYNVIHVSFATQNRGRDYDLKFIPAGYTSAQFKNEIQNHQLAGKKVFISIGGQNDPVFLDSLVEKEVFVTSVNKIIDDWGFDGIDIDLEGTSLKFNSINIANPGDIRQQYMIDAIKEIMANYRVTHNQKLLLTMAPETVYVQGGLSDWAVTNAHGGAYLPMIEALKDSIDMLNVQLYNSGSMFGLDGKVYEQSTPDFVVAMTEALIKGYTSRGNIGTFSGLPASKVGIGLPGCNGYGYVDPQELEAAIKYLTGKGPKPGTYTLQQAGGYPDLRGMMTWSINSDKRCSPSYGYVTLYEQLFSDNPFIKISNKNKITITKEDQGEITVELFNGKFTKPINKDHWSVSNLPTNVSIASINRDNDSLATIILSGNSVGTGGSGHISNVTVTIDSNGIENSSTSISKGHGVKLTDIGFLLPRRIEAEAFHDMKGVEIRTAQDATNGTKLGNWHNGDYTEYNIVVPDSGGVYGIELRVATAQNNIADYSFQLDGQELLRSKLASTGGWESWKTINHEIILPAGEHKFKFYTYSGHLGLNWMNFVYKYPVGIDENIHSQLGIFPNPVKNTLHIENHSAGTITITDITGKIIIETSVSSTNETLDVSTLSEGVYQIMLNDSNDIKTYSRFIKE